MLSFKAESKNSFPLLIAMTFRNDKERQLLMLEEKKLYRNQFKREAMNQCKEPIRKKATRLRGTTFAIVKLKS